MAADVGRLIPNCEFAIGGKNEHCMVCDVGFYSLNGGCLTSAACLATPGGYEVFERFCHRKCPHACATCTSYD